jgi:hypothetical protein
MTMLAAGDANFKRSFWPPTTSPGLLAWNGGQDIAAQQKKKDQGRVRSAHGNVVPDCGPLTINNPGAANHRLTGNSFTYRKAVSGLLRQGPSPSLQPPPWFAPPPIVVSLQM